MATSSALRVGNAALGVTDVPVLPGTTQNS